MNFSLVMPIRNGSRFIQTLRKNVESLMRAGDEFVVVDDNSEDSSYKMLQNWASENPQIRLISNPTPGLAHALNLGIRESTHNFIARVDADDTYDSSRLFSQEIQLSGDCVAVFSDYTFHDEADRDLGYIASAITPLSTSLSLLSSSRTPHPSVVFRKDVFNFVGGYKQTDFPCEDLSLWLRFDKVGLLKTVPKPLLRYRLNKTGVTSTKREQMQGKRIQLINDLGVRDDLRIASVDSWEKEISQLDNNSLGNIRRILLLRDFRMAKKYHVKIKDARYIEAILKKEIFSCLTTPSDLLNLSYERLLRRIHR